MVAKLFLSHATEDKATVVVPLYEELRIRGLEVWFDEYSLRAGDKLRRSIEKGLYECDYGVVILSESFFAKEWAQRELDTLHSIEIARKADLIIPIWHEIGIEQIISKAPMMADRLVLSTSVGARKLAAKIFSIVSSKGIVTLPVWVRASVATDMTETIYKTVNSAKLTIQDILADSDYFCDFHRTNATCVILRGDRDGEYHKPVCFYFKIHACCRPVALRALKKLSATTSWNINDIIVEDDST
jgi:TIR domain